MLAKDPADRISAETCQDHPWFKINHITDVNEKDKLKVMKRIREFRLPQRLQIETLTFLVNSVENQNELDFEMLKNAFRALDTDNSGTLSMTEIRNAFVEMKIPP